jgi:23S rRNA (cytidine1920-2'-O)/16S rRNA (cytidine1409-2'-O)-methyltransferase
MKKRLDVLLVERGLAESRTQAQALVLAGLVPGYDKPGHQVPEDAELSVAAPPRYVSRGGEKLANALGALHLELDGRDAIDLGASTGGFTDYLLQHGVARVIAVDVGYGQLHPKLRDDSRVTVLERTNARELRELPYTPDLLVCDVSFIGVRLVLPPVLRLLQPGWGCRRPRQAAVRGRSRRGRQGRRRPRPGDPPPGPARGRRRRPRLGCDHGRRRRLRAARPEGQSRVLRPPDRRRPASAAG